MNLHTKGFAVSSILYSIMIIFTFLIFTVIVLFANSKVTFDKMKTDMKASLDGVDKVILVPNGLHQTASLGLNEEIISYFTYKIVGESPITGIVCRDKTRSNTIVSNVEELNIGNHEIECTITKSNGYVRSAITNILVTSEYTCNSVIVGTTGNISYGGYVNGDEYECDPGDGIGRRFYVIGSDATTVTLIMDRNIGNNVTWNSTGGSVIQEAANQLQMMTNNWDDVVVSFPTKVTITNVTGGTTFNTSPYAFLGTNTNCSNTTCNESATNGTNKGYWVNTYESGAYAVTYTGTLSVSEVTSEDYGVRPVITVNKSEVYDSYSGLQNIVAAITPTGWAASKTATITYPANMNNLIYEYSVDGTNWALVEDRQAVLTLTSNGYVIGRMRSGNNTVKATTFNVSQIDTISPVLTSLVTSVIETSSLSTDIFENYFTITNNGAAPITNTVCIDTNHSNAEVVNVNQLTVDGIHELSCTVTKANGLTDTKLLTIETFKISYQYNYSSSGEQTFIIPKTGYYLLEGWGAAGGRATYTSIVYYGGKGAYVGEYIYLTKGTSLFMYVGGEGQDSYATTTTNSYTANGNGYNGGAAATYAINNSAHSGGGGATHFALTSTGPLSSSSIPSSNVLLIAGGGGGAAAHTSSPSWSGNGGAGGVYLGQSAQNASIYYYCFAYGGTDSSTGYAANSSSAQYCSQVLASYSQGGGATSYTGATKSGGGGGYYGGGGGLHGAAAGGSSYINFSKSKVYQKAMIAGNYSMPTPSGGTSVGNSNGGHAKVTYITNIENELLNTNDEFVYNYTGNDQTFKAPTAGYYKLEAWGAGGGNAVGNDSNACPNGGYAYGKGCGGSGSYTAGTTYLNANDMLYVYVGGAGATGVVGGYAKSGYNGGGQGEFDHNDNEAGGSGGGATDFRLTNTNQKYRYIRDYAAGSSANGSSHWVEIQVYDTNGNNISYRKDISTSIAATSGYGAERILDGDLTSDNYSDYASANSLTYVEIDLGTEVDISYVKIWHYYTDGRIYYSTKTILYNSDRTVTKTIFDSAVSGTYAESAGGRISYVQNVPSLASRIMVAGGGGGASDVWKGGNGGITSSIDERFSAKATQTSGFMLGIGENAYYHTSNIESGGGGGGYYGGKSLPINASNNGQYGHTGTGGSSYVSGCSGCNSVNSSGSNTGSSTHYSGKIFSNITMLPGGTGQPTLDGGLQTGNYLNGKAKITYLGDNQYLNTDTTLFGYTNSIQTFTDPRTGDYILETWGAQGGESKYSTLYTGGSGGYSRGTVHLTGGQTVYVVVGGKGVNAYGTTSVELHLEGRNYNGGSDYTFASSNSIHSGSGGATHIATTSGLLSTLSSNQSSILIVAGGGGASSSHANTPSYSGNGGSGGGTTGTNGITGNTTCYNYGLGGTQSAGGSYQTCATDPRSDAVAPGSFGLGGMNSGSFAGGGAGYYGGGGGWHGPGGGGSGYVSSSLTNRSMSCLNCTTDSITKSISTDSELPLEGVAKIGSGYARITYVDPNVTHFFYTNATQTYSVPSTGKYRIELWGATGGGIQGDGRLNKGGYTSGEINLTAGETLYFYVGEGLSRINNVQSFNGGTGNSGGYAAGGATDVRLVSGTWTNTSGLLSRIMVAAGSGSASGGNNSSAPGNGGGLIGYDGGGTDSGTQKTYGAAQYSGYTESSFGIANGGCAGGNGFYPGGGSTCVNGAGGGSSFISGHTGCIATVSGSTTSRTGSGGAACIESGTTPNNYTGTGDNLCSVHYSGKVFVNTLMIDGAGYSWTNIRSSQLLMPYYFTGNYSLGQGNIGHGHAKITYLGIN